MKSLKDGVKKKKAYVHAVGLGTGGFRVQSFQLVWAENLS